MPRVLRQPARVLRVLAEMAPLGSVGPVTLREVREVLAPRLLTLDARTAAPASWAGVRRHAAGGARAQLPGRLRAGTRRAHLPAAAARGRAAARRPPRRAWARALAVADTRADDERLQLRLAVGAAAERIHLSYPRLELAESRPRVPSFYVLDVMRATTGRIPRYKTLSDLAFENGGASLDWPAPPIARGRHRRPRARPGGAAPAAARRRRRSASPADGRARYLLELNPSLLRSMTRTLCAVAAGIASGRRPQPRRRPDAAGARPARLTARPYSLTALQRFAACPYQFQLAAIYRLAPLEEPAPLQRLDPLTKGSLFHEIQTEFLRAAQANGMLPVTAARAGRAADARVGDRRGRPSKADDDLAPAIDRVWKRRDRAPCAATCRCGSSSWSRDGEHWVPERFELAFGLPGRHRPRPGSVAEPVEVGEQGFLLRGSIDLVERRVDGQALRVTDHKTGKNRTTLARSSTAGGCCSRCSTRVALEAITGEPVDEGRLSYCTAAGGFTEQPIALDRSSGGAASRCSRSSIGRWSTARWPRGRRRGRAAPAILRLRPRVRPRRAAPLEAQAAARRPRRAAEVP